MQSNKTTLQDTPRRRMPASMVRPIRLIWTSSQSLSGHLITLIPGLLAGLQRCGRAGNCTSVRRSSVTRRSDLPPGRNNGLPVTLHVDHGPAQQHRASCRGGRSWTVGHSRIRAPHPCDASRPQAGAGRLRRVSSTSIVKLLRKIPAASSPPKFKGSRPRSGDRQEHLRKFANIPEIPCWLQPIIMA